MLFCAAFTASTIAPANPDAAAEPLITLANKQLPKVTVPDLLAAQAEPILTSSEPVAAAPVERPGAAEAPAPAVKPTGDLQAMVSQLRGSVAGSRELECLATGIYFESKGEPLTGQLAVGQVIANRAQSGRFPSTYCGVLLQRGQFSFVRGGSLPSAPTSRQGLESAFMTLVHHPARTSRARAASGRACQRGWPAHS